MYQGQHHNDSKRTEINTIAIFGPTQFNQPPTQHCQGQNICSGVTGGEKYTRM